MPRLLTSGLVPERQAQTYRKPSQAAAAKHVRETPVRPLLLDTAVLLWWLQDPARLSRVARSRLATVQDTPLLVSAVSFWEIGLKAQRGQLDLGDTFNGFMTRIESMSGLSILPVDLAIWRQVLALEWDHRDPVDRIIVATAMQHHATLVSSDRVIRAFYSQTVW
nr:type II toxin-antitoxin system VapC family toxin [Gemmatimonas phototrophica]